MTWAPIESHSNALHGTGADVAERETSPRGICAVCLLAGQHEPLRIGGDPDPAPPPTHARL
jgi:hypothetical protein